MNDQVLNEALVEQSLQTFIDPDMGKDIVSAKLIQAITIEHNHVTLNLLYSYPMLSRTEALTEALTQHLHQSFGEHLQVSCEFAVKVHTHQVPGAVKPLAQVKNIVAIASGKGGVGKSTTAVNLALALSQEGASVGILDADIYGPSQPLMLGLVDAQPETVDKKSIEPVENHGIQTMSIGYLIAEEQATVWRGPMASGALQQLLNDTRWRALDYLIVDLPPGTGDIQLTLAQKVPVTAAVIVTTPQDVALADARKAVSMFNKVNVPVLGVIENMGLHVCSNCGHEEAIFGLAGGAGLAERIDVDYLGGLPLDRRIREDCDFGKPTVVADPEHAVTKRYAQIARTMAAKLALRDRDYATQFPTITITND